MGAGAARQSVYGGVAAASRLGSAALARAAFAGGMDVSFAPSKSCTYQTSRPRRM